jgi:hypothetical protein
MEREVEVLDKINKGMRIHAIRCHYYVNRLKNSSRRINTKTGKALSPVIY